MTQQIEQALGEIKMSAPSRMTDSQVMRVKMKSEKDIAKELERLSLEYISRKKQDSS